MKRVYAVLAARFSDAAVTIDTTVSNAARIWTLDGTLKRKGDSTTERPHRRAWIASRPDPLELVTRAQLEAVAALDQPTRPKRSSKSSTTMLDMRAEFEQRGWYLRELSGGKHAVRCPWADAHSGESGPSETVLFDPRAPREVWGVQMPASHCAGRTIRDVWELVRPPVESRQVRRARERREAKTVIEPRALTDTIATFRRWLHLDHPAPVFAVAATLVANRAPGDPVWLLLVCAPSTGKTEILSAAAGLPYAISAAKVTEASLLSGTSKRERTTGATGGLLRQVGEFGVLLCKDFTSVLAQNNDQRNEAMAALREVYDGNGTGPLGRTAAGSLMAGEVWADRGRYACARSIRTGDLRARSSIHTPAAARCPRGRVRGGGLATRRAGTADAAGATGRVGRPRRARGHPPCESPTR